MTNIDPRFYVVQVVFFTLGAVLFGIFADFLRKEAQLNGWSPTARLGRFACLCCSSFGFLMVQLDSYGALGIYSDPWQYFMGHLDASLLVGSVCASLYMFVFISFKGETIPLLVVRLWIASNVGGFIIVFIDALILAITDNIFWSFVCSATLMCQETFLYLGFLIIVFRTTRVLKSMGQTTDYSTQIGKLWKSFLLASCVFAAAFTNQAMQLLSKAKWGVAVPVTNHEVFEADMMIPDLILLSGHCVLLFMLRPPKNRLSTTSRIRLTMDSKASSGGSGGSSNSSPASCNSTLASKEANSSQVELCIVK